MTQRRIYQEEYPYFITTNIKNGIWFFDKVKYAKLLSNIIFQACRLKKHILYAYCIMPDHLHALVGKDVGSHLDKPIAGTEAHAGIDIKMSSKFTPAHPSAGAVGDGDYNISQLMHAIKSYYCLAMRTQHGVNHPIWQPRFNTRIVDNEERLQNTIEYIKNNPIKNDLDKKYQREPYIYLNKKLIDSLFG
jgi:REP element-mobilizing transposase RayT